MWKFQTPLYAAFAIDNQQKRKIASLASKYGVELKKQTETPKVYPNLDIEQNGFDYHQ